MLPLRTHLSGSHGNIVDCGKQWGKARKKLHTLKDYNILMSRTKTEKKCVRELARVEVRFSIRADSSEWKV